MIYLSLVCDSRERDNDEKRSIVALLLHEVGDEGNGLDGLTKTHLICQDPVEMIVVEGHKPLQTFDLVRKGRLGRGGGGGGEGKKEGGKGGRMRRNERD